MPKIKTKDGRFLARLYVCSELANRGSGLVDVELLLVDRGIALHDDRALRHFFHLV